MVNNKIDKKIIVLGSTGSVGTQALDVARCNGVRVEGITAAKNSKEAEEQARAFGVSFCAMYDEDAAKDLKARLADTNIKVFSGTDGIVELIENSAADTAVNSITGIAGLKPTLAAIDKGMNIALANKETLVTAGDIVMSKAREKGVCVLPVDSEHCAIFQCLRCGGHKEVEKLILTASGGPFFGKTKDELSGITKEQALAHPTWKMGAKITVDSATMMNKGFEVIEAYHLFGVPADKIDVVVHRESIIHSMVEFCDGAVIAQLSVPDMRMCVRYALSYPERVTGNGKRLDLTEVSKLTFAKPDEKTFTLLPLAREAISLGGVVPCALNGANEAAVDLFLHEKISFTDIFTSVEKVALSFDSVPKPTIDDIFEADKISRIKTKEVFGL